MVIGITGKMGSGKTSVALCFQEWGARLISADRLGWELLDDPVLKDGLVREFGAGILNADGSVDRKRLGSRAFESREKLDALNRVVHPRLLRLLKREIEELARRSMLVVVDAALITEWGIADWFDKVIAVVCPEELKIKRLVKTGMPEQDARKRLSLQVSDEVRGRSSHFVLENCGSLAELREKSRVLFDSLEKEARRARGEPSGGGSYGGKP